jgi:hypothetical protein
MKNQYFGDVKDYLTYGLLRTLQRVSGLRVGVAWMLTPDTPNGEGELRDYLNQPQVWQAHDPRLFADLQRVPEHGRRVNLADQFDLIPGALYYNEPLPQDAAARQDYFRQLFQDLQPCQLLFFDPDNGLETKTTPRSARRSIQHIYWLEVVEAFHQHGHSLLIFQHFPRRSRENYLEERAQEFAARLGVERIEWFQTSQVVFFLAARPEHSAALQKAPEAVQAQWGAHMWPGARVFLPEKNAGLGFHLTLLPAQLSVCRLAPQSPLPPWAGGELTAFTRTPDELSIVCEQQHVPHGVQAEKGWRALKVAGPLDFSLTGVLAALAAPLAAAKISIFALSTFDTDYLLVKETTLHEALHTLRNAGHHIQLAENDRPRSTCTEPGQ